MPDNPLVEMNSHDGLVMSLMVAGLGLGLRFFWINEDSYPVFRKTYAFPILASFGVASLILAIVYPLFVLLWPPAPMEWSAFAYFAKLGFLVLSSVFLLGLIPKKEGEKRAGVQRVWWILMNTIFFFVLLVPLSRKVGLPSKGPWDLTLFPMMYSIGLCGLSVYFRRLLPLSMVIAGFIPVCTPFLLALFLKLR